MIVNRGIFRVPPESSGGGAEKHGYNLANNLAKLGHEVFFVSKIRPGGEYDRSVTVYPIPPRRGVIPPKTSFFGWIMKHLFGNVLSVMVTLRILASDRSGFHVVHCHGALAALLLSKLIGWRIPIIYTMHDPSPWIAEYPGTHRRAFRKLAYLLIDVPCLRSASHVIAVCPSLRDEATRLGAPPSKVSFIPNGIQVPSAPQGSASEKVEFGLFVGQLVRRKRVDLILSAAKRLSEGTRFVIVGDGPETRSLKELSVKLGVSDAVTFTGFVNDQTLANYYAVASFFVFPSTAESFGLVTFEAMAHGVPAVVGRMRVYDGMLFHNQNALLFAPGNVDDLVEQIRRLAGNQELRRTLGANGQSFVREHLSWDKVAQRVSSVYAAVWARRRAHSH